MGRPRIVECDYYSFRTRLQRATDAGKRIEPVDGEAWKAYLREHKLSDVTMRAWAKQKFAYGEASLVVLDYGDAEWDGFYAYSEADEATLKWVRDPD